MVITSFNLMVMLACIACLFAQLLVKKKDTSHLLFAIFCGSVAMSLLQKIAGDSIGAYQYVIGLGTVATCNCYWLFTRTLFRTEKAIAAHHLALALFISGLIFIKQGYAFASHTELIVTKPNAIAHHLLSEVTLLLSSCIIVLSFWEGCRGFQSVSKQAQIHRLVFLTTFALAVGISKLSDGLFANDSDTKAWIISAIILFIVVMTQLLLLWKDKIATNTQHHALPFEHQCSQLPTVDARTTSNEADRALAQQIEQLIQQQQLYLTANLKVADIARALDVPEYRIGKALRCLPSASNFNQLINQFRIEHAQELLLNPNNQHWSVLVVGLESGFASVGPFTRAFKTQTGFTPNQFRQQQMEKLPVNVPRCG